MQRMIASITCTILFLSSCTEQGKRTENTPAMPAPATDSIPFKNGYSNVNGLNMYYEIYGEGKPLVLIHGGGSTIQTSFGRIIPQLARHRQIIGVELQAHGRTGDRNTALSFEQDADDVAVLLKNLNIARADIFGFSNGGTTALQLAIRHPGLVNKVIAGSALCKRNGAPAQFWEFMKGATLAHMPQPYKDAYTQIAPDPGSLQTMHDKCAERMITFADMDDGQLRSIKAPVLILLGDADVMTPEHAVDLHRLIPGSRLAILPGGHGEYMGEITTLGGDFNGTDYSVPLIEGFLDNGFQK